MLSKAGGPMSKKILIMTGDGGDSYEALYAYHRLLEARWEPVIAAPSRRRLHLVIQDFEPGWETYTERPGYSVEPDVVLTAVAAKEFAAVLIIFAIGHGIQLLAAADLIKGRTVACHPHVRIDVERSGGTYSPKPAIRDGKIVTGQTWQSHPEFYREVFGCLG
jgi:protease I